MTFTAKPSYLQWLAVVRVMLLRLLVSAALTRLRQQLAPALVHVGISARHGPLPLLWGKVSVPWATFSGIRSMARATVSLGQAVVWSTAF